MAGEDRAYTDWLHERRCQAPTHVCSGPTVVHHPTHLRHTGHDARRAHDHHGVTLCDSAHKALHSLAPNGPFAKSNRDDIRLFCELAAAENRSQYEGRGTTGVVLDVFAGEVPF